MARATFRDLIAANKRNSLLLMTLFGLFTTVVMLVLALALVAILSPDTIAQLDWGEAMVVGGIAGGVSLLVILIGFYSGQNMVLAVAGAKPIQHSDDPQLFNVVEEMAIAAGIPMPKVYLIDDPSPNAFATGRDPQHAVVAITTGLRSKLNREELQGVIAHEISHIRNYDIRLMLLMAVLIGTIVMLADIFWQMLWFSPGTGRRRSDSRDDKGGGWVVVVIVVLAILLSLVAPILAQIIQLAVSRQREYLADASAVELTRNPQGLADALRKIDSDPADLKHANRGIAHLYIDNPIDKQKARAHSIWASHPPIEDRIRRLEGLLQ